MPQIFLGVATGLLATVEQSEAALGQVQAVIRLMPDQHDTGAVRHVTVIGYVDKQLRADTILYPAMEDRDCVSKIDQSGLAREDLHRDVLNRIHGAYAGTATG